MLTRPYSIYIDKRPIRIAFLVDPSPDSMEKVDQIIEYNRGLWGGRYNPIILTDGNTIEDKWWKFLRDVDPDIIKPLVPLSTGLIEKFEKFLSPLMIEEFKEDAQSDLGTWVNTRITAAGIDINSPNIYKNLALFGDPVLGTFNADEMDDDTEKLFVHRNFGISSSMGWSAGWDTFSIPTSLEGTLSRGEVPSEVHEGFKEKELDKRGIPLSKEAFSKKSAQYPEKWAIIDKENNRIHYVEHKNGKLFVWPRRQNSGPTHNEIEKKMCLVTNRGNLAEALLDLSQAQNIVYRDQICAFPNTERDIQNGWQSHFEVVVGDTLQDIVHFWNRPWLLGKWKRKYMSQMWLPTTLATDPSIKDALCSWIKRNVWKENNNPGTVRFVSFSNEQPELESIADNFKGTLSAFTHAKHYTEPQIPNLTSEHLSFFLDENPLSSRDSSIETCRAQGTQDILEVTEPNGLDQHYPGSYWMADFYIEFTHNRDGNQMDLIRWINNMSLFWKFPNRNHLTSNMFNRFSRIKQNGFPSALMKRGEKVLRLTLENPEAVVASLFYSNNRHVYANNDPRVQVTTTPYYSSEVSDKGKYLQGVLELFGDLTFAYEVFRNPYWRAMFDFLSKNTHAEQTGHQTIINKLTKSINREGSLTSENEEGIKSVAALVMNEAKKLDLRQNELPFDKFAQESEVWRDKYTESITLPDNQDEMEMIDFHFGEEALKRSLAGLTERNVIQFGVKPRCLSCGMASWYHVDDIGQQLTCQGCRSLFPLAPELTWQYRLNSLVHTAYASHGTTPVILVLGQLFRESRISFFFSPNLNLLARPQDELSEKKEIMAEVDIACIQDGKFIIGEVKQSMNLFKKTDFDDMAEIARRTKPDIVLFSCMDSDEPRPLITQNIERIQSELSELEIDVKWYALESLNYSYRV